VRAPCIKKKKGLWESRRGAKAERKKMWVVRKRNDKRTQGGLRCDEKKKTGKKKMKTEINKRALSCTVRKRKGLSRKKKRSRKEGEYGQKAPGKNVPVEAIGKRE